MSVLQDPCEDTLPAGIVLFEDKRVGVNHRKVALAEAIRQFHLPP